MTDREALIESERANLIRAITHGHVDVADWQAYDAAVAALAVVEAEQGAPAEVGEAYFHLTTHYHATGCHAAPPENNACTCGLADHLADYSADIRAERAAEPEPQSVAEAREAVNIAASIHRHSDIASESRMAFEGAVDALIAAVTIQVRESNHLG